jgi:hypothetical protein
METREKRSLGKEKKSTKSEGSSCGLVVKAKDS